MDPIIAIIIIVALVVGLALGWFLGSRSAASLASDRAARSEQLQKLLDAVTGERDEAQRSRAALEADARNFDARMTDLKESKDALIAQFRTIGDQLLEKAHKDFLVKADDRFAKADKEHSVKLQSLLKPVETTLKRYEDGLQRVEKERVDQYAGLREAVAQMRVGQGQVRDETRNLVNALRSSPKARGRWGEQSLRNVLEQSGLSPYADFRTEVSIDTDGGRLRPDVIVRLPGGRQLIIDAKCSLNAFLDANDEIDDDKRAGHLRAHAASIRNHAQQLGSKAYWAQFGDAADYVVMYIPGEHFLTAALEQDVSLWDWAFERRVLLATPTNLVAIARTVASVWQQERVAHEAANIVKIGKELYARLATMGSHVVKLGRNLELATGAYNSFIGSLETQVMTQARRFEALNVSVESKPIENLVPIDQTTRPLTKLSDKVAD